MLEDGVGIIGGCCGTEAAHIAALDQMLRRIGRDRPRPCRRRAMSPGSPSVASLYGQVPLRQENAYLSIGERCNANGSRAFRRLQEAGDWDGCVEMGREQVKEGSHTLDVCTAFVGRDEIAEMSEVVSRMRGAINAPLVIDSTEYPVLEAALKLYGGKPIINSINFEDGEEAADKRLKLAKRFGAAVIALTIDEQGMAKEADRQAADRRAALRFRLQQARSAAERPAVRSADLHDLHRQRGRPQARPQHARRDRRDRASACPSARSSSASPTSRSASTRRRGRC